MSDKSYDHGVTPESVCDMVDDMYKCVSGRNTYIKMPIPLKGTGASMYMNFIDNDPVYVSDLSPRKRRTAGSNRVHASMVSRARFTLSVDPAQSMINIDPNHDATIQAVDDLIKDISVQDSISDYSIDDRGSSNSRAFMSDTSADATDDYHSDDNGEMEDLDNDGLPIHRVQAFDRPKPVLKRVESIVHPDFHNTQDIRIGAPAGRFGRRM
jgi:hypothetical protein